MNSGSEKDLPNAHLGSGDGEVGTEQEGEEVFYIRRRGQAWIEMRSSEMGSPAHFLEPEKVRYHRAPSCRMEVRFHQGDRGRTASEGDPLVLLHILLGGGGKYMRQPLAWWSRGSKVRQIRVVLYGVSNKSSLEKKPFSS